MHRTFIVLLATALSGCLMAASAQSQTSLAPMSQAPASAAPASSSAAEANNAISDTDRSALAQYQRDLVSVLALRADARHLLGAALLAQPLSGLPDALSHHKLLQRAAEGDDADNAVRWAQLADCGEGSECPNPQALGTLKQTDADNAAVWLLALQVAAHNDDMSAERAALSRAAAAGTFETYYGASLQALSAAATALPVPADLRKAGQRHDIDNPTAQQALLAYGIAAGQPQPDTAPALKLCADDDSLAAECHKLAHLLEWGSTAAAHLAGLRLKAALATDDKARTEAERAQRSFIWQMQHAQALFARSGSDAALARRILAVARKGGTELNNALTLLRGENVPLDPPQDWQPGAAPAAPSTSGAH